MNTADLKIKIFRQVDSLDDTKIQELYGILLNYINGNTDIDEWDKLSTDEKQGIDDAIQELNSGKGIPHENIIEKYKLKYPNA